MKRLILLSLVAALPVLADETQITLKEGLGKEAVMANCVACHSLDYIPMNSPFLDHKRWEATVHKMVKVMGAPIREEDIPLIIDYLTKNYGVE